MTGQKMNYKASMESPEPIMPSQIPNIKIDYKGLIKYAEVAEKPVIALSDKEKNAYIVGSSMDGFRRKSATYSY